MSRHTFACSAGRRVDVQPDKFSPGLVRLQILSANKEILGSCTLNASIAGLLAQALLIEAEKAEISISHFRPPVGQISANDAADAACEESSKGTNWEVPVLSSSEYDKQKKEMRKAVQEDDMFTRDFVA